ncbi:BatD family protein [Myxococcota bacterium]|nr:BatD family protein [Myxococcota bacterium]MBU1899781.1 BatD family protein [Myxococcota bacterium]
MARALFLLMLLPALGLAAPSLEVYADRTQLSFDERLNLHIKLQIDDPAGGTLDEPPLDQWSFVDVDSVESVSYDKRRRRQVKRVQRTLRPEVAGDLEIGAFTLRSGGAVIRSAPIKIKVTQGAAAAPQAPKASDDDDAVPDPTIFLRWEVEPEGPLWAGQQLYATLAVYHRADLQLTDLNTDRVDLAGFWYQDLTQRQPSGRQVILGNRRMVRMALAEHALVPLHDEGLTLPKINAQLRLSTRGILRRRSQRFERAAPALPLEIRPLPSQGRPKGSVAVGRVTLQATLDQSQIKLGEGAQLTLKTQINGLIQSAPAIKLPALPGARVYPPSEDTQTEARGGRLWGTRTQAWLIKPQAAGVLEIPGFQISYFDPDTGRYQVAETRPLKLGVEAASGDVAGAATATPLSEAQIKAKGPQLRTIRQAPRLGSDAPALGWPLLTLALSPLIFLIPLGLQAGRRRRLSGAEARAARQALREARARLGRLSAKQEGVYAALSRIALDYLQARLQATLSGLTHGQLRATLAARGVSEAQIGALITELENCDFARFAPASRRDDVLEAAARMEATLSQIEAALRRVEVAS